jgi:hypothetical protein
MYLDEPVANKSNKKQKGKNGGFGLMDWLATTSLFLTVVYTLWKLRP